MLWLLVLVVVVLGVTQLVAPRIATKVMKDRVARYGEVESASVSAFPAIKLLWGDADAATARASALSMTPTALVALLTQARSIDRLTVDVAHLELKDPGFGVGALKLEHASLRKRGASMLGSAILTERNLASALPAGVKATLVAGEGDAADAAGGLRGVRLKARGSLLGLSAEVQARVHAESGKLVLTPTAPSFASLVKITLFADRRMKVLGVAARRAPGLWTPSTPSWLLTLKARLR